METHLKRLIVRYREANNPEERLSLALKLTFSFLNTNPNVAYQYITEASIIAESIGSKEGYAESIRLKGLYYLITEKYSDASEQLSNSYSQFEKISNTSGMVNCLINIGVVQDMQSQYTSALETYQGALTKIKKNKLPIHFQASCLTNIGYVYERMGNYHKALAYSNKAVSVCEKSGMVVESVLPKANSALYLMKLERYDVALPMFHQLLNEYEQVFDKNNRAATLNYLGLIYYELGDNVKSLSFFQKGLKAQGQTNNRIGMANALQGLGKIFTRLRGFDEATIYLSRSLSIMEEIKQLDGKCRVLLSLGLNAFLSNKLAIAEKYLKQSLVIAEELALVSEASKALACMVEIAKRNNDDAFIVYEQQLKAIANEKGN